MPLILKPRQVVQPQGLFKIDWSNPLARDLKTFITCIEGRMIDLVSGVQLVNAGDAYPVTDRNFGRAMYMPASANGKLTATIPPIALNNDFGLTSFARVRVFTDDWSIIKNVLTFRTSGGTFVHGVRFANGSNPRMYFMTAYTSSSRSREITSPGSPSTNTPRFLSYSQSPNRDRDGVPYVTGLPAAAATSGAGTGNYVGTISQVTMGDSVNLAGQIALGGLFARRLTAAEHRALNDNPWQLLKAPPTRVFFVDVPGSGSQTLSPPLFTNDNTFYAPSLTLGAVSLSPSLLSNDNAIYAPSLTLGAVTLSPPLVSNAQTFYAPSVTVGAVSLSPPLLTNTQTFYAATINQAGGAQTLSPPLFTNSQTFYAPSITLGVVTLSAPLVTNSQTFYAATINCSITLSPPLLTNINSFYAPAVTVGAVTLSPALLTNAQEFYGATIIMGGLAPTPGYRRVTVAAQVRSVTIGADRRTVSVPAQSRLAS